MMLRLQDLLRIPHHHVTSNNAVGLLSLRSRAARLMFARVSLRAGDRVLDAACGTGIVTRVAIQRYGHLGHIVGVDLNVGMLDVARAHTPATRVPIEWRHGDV